MNISAMVESPAMPDIASLSTAMAQNKVMSDFGTAMLAESLDTFESSGDDMKRMMELSVNPSVGANIDVSL